MFPLSRCWNLNQLLTGMAFSEITRLDVKNVNSRSVLIIEKSIGNITIASLCDLSI